MSICRLRGLKSIGRFAKLPKLLRAAESQCCASMIAESDSRADAKH